MDAIYTVVFYIFAAMVLIAASAVVFSRNIVRSAFALLFAFFGVAGLYVFLLADFIAITQLLVYVGGILVLILFGIMLTNRQINVDIKSGTLHVLPALIIVSAIAGTLVGVFWSYEWFVNDTIPPYSTTAYSIGELLLTKYLLPFEIASVLLIVALVGAAMIARRDKKGKTGEEGELL